MLTVDWYDLAAAAQCCRCRQVARHHQRFLVGERDALSRLQRRERGVETGRTDDGVEHDVHVSACRGLDEAALTGAPSVVLWSAVVHEADERRTESRYLLLEERRVGERRQRRDTKSVALPVEHAERGRADRAG